MHIARMDDEKGWRESMLAKMTLIQKTVEVLNRTINKQPRFINRKEIVALHGQRFYQKLREAVPAIKSGSKTSVVRFEREDYERFLAKLKERP